MVYWLFLNQSPMEKTHYLVRSVQRILLKSSFPQNIVKRSFVSLTGYEYHAMKSGGNPSSSPTCLLIPSLSFSMEKEGESTKTEPYRKQFRNRVLNEEESVFKHNAWDDVEWDEKQEEEAQKLVDINSEKKYSQSEREKFENEAGKFWDDFYSKHCNKFFKDRHWLFVEFPELNVQNRSEGDKIKMLEIGCGVGNTIMPLLQSDLGQNLYIYGCDFSEKAVNILKEHSLYDESLCHAFVCDVTCDEWTVPFQKNSLDIVTAIFVLSAITPEKHRHVIRKIKEYLKPGGLLLFRDYGRYDLAQLRFKSGQCLSDNFYARGDGTRVYFFTQDEVKNMFTEEGFIEEQNYVDRRLQVNRSKLLKMYRIWILGKYRKPS